MRTYVAAIGLALLLYVGATALLSGHPAAPQTTTQAASAVDATVQVKTPPTDSLSLIVLPRDGIKPLLSMIGGAEKSVDLVMYQLEDPQVEEALAAAQARGVAVRVLLNKGYYGKQEGRNQPAYEYLESKGVAVHWTPAYFALTHQKTLVVDGEKALIMTFNLVPKYYATGRDFGIVDTEPSDVAAIEEAFDADWNGNRIPAPADEDLVWSPGSEDEMLALIASAKSSLDVYNEEMADSAVITALEDAAERGVEVEVDMTYQSSWKKAFQALVAAGVHVRTYASSAPLYIHAKMILADGARAFVGSENFSPTSLNKNRELGIVIDDPGIIASLADIFRTDWQGARVYQ